jgi:hypothetical protein
MKTVPQMGWAGVKNNQLLALAEAEFDVFITVDRNLSFQQNLPQFDIAVIVLQAPSNRLADWKPLASKVLPIAVLKKMRYTPLATDALCPMPYALCPMPAFSTSCY